MSEGTRQPRSQQQQINHVLQEALYCHVAFSVEDRPYVLPLSFGYEDNALYIHCALSGKKLEMLEKNPHVSFAAETGVELEEASTACKYAMRYSSVIGHGTAAILEDPDEKTRGLNAVVSHYNADPIEYSRDDLDKLKMIKISIENITYKETETSN